MPPIDKILAPVIGGVVAGGLGALEAKNNPKLNMASNTIVAGLGGAVIGAIGNSAIRSAKASKYINRAGRMADEIYQAAGKAKDRVSAVEREYMTGNVDRSSSLWLRANKIHVTTPQGEKQPVSFGSWMHARDTSIPNYFEAKKQIRKDLNKKPWWNFKQTATESTEQMFNPHITNINTLNNKPTSDITDKVDAHLHFLSKKYPEYYQQSRRGASASNEQISSWKQKYPGIENIVDESVENVGREGKRTEDAWEEFNRAWSDFTRSTGGGSRQSHQQSYQRQRYTAPRRGNDDPFSRNFQVANFQDTLKQYNIHGTTKKEVTTKARQKMMDLHPDKNPQGEEEFKKFKAVWDKVKEHPDFQKLAYYKEYYTMSFFENMAKSAGIKTKMLKTLLKTPGGAGGAIGGAVTGGALGTVVGGIGGAMSEDGSFLGGALKGGLIGAGLGAGATAGAGALSNRTIKAKGVQFADTATGSTRNMDLSQIVRSSIRNDPKRMAARKARQDAIAAAKAGANKTASQAGAAMGAILGAPLPVVGTPVGAALGADKNRRGEAALGGFLGKNFGMLLGLGLVSPWAIKNLNKADRALESTAFGRNLHGLERASDYEERAAMLFGTGGLGGAVAGAGIGAAVGHGPNKKRK